MEGVIYTIVLMLKNTAKEQAGEKERNHSGLNKARTTTEGRHIKMGRGQDWLVRFETWETEEQPIINGEAGD